MEKIQLLKLIHAADLDALAAELGKLDDSQRRKLSTTASTWGKFFSQHGDGLEINGLDKKLAQLKDMGINARTRNPFWDQAAVLAVVGCCPISQVKKLDFVFWRRNQLEELAIKVLVGRSPQWIDELISLKLAHRGEFPVVSWRFVNELVRQRICEKPESDDYIVALTTAPDQFCYQDNFEVQLKQIENSPGFFSNDIYRIFDVDSHAFFDTYKAEDRTWTKLIHRWLNEGKLDRQQLIASSIRGMSHTFKKNVISGFCKFFDSLEPQVEELEPHVEELGGLLANSHGTVINLALTHLKSLHKSKLIESQRLLAFLPAVFDCRLKAQPKSALTLIHSIGKKEDGLIPEALNSVMSALEHENADIQEKALSIIEQWADRAHCDHAIVINEQLGGLSPHLVVKAKALISQLGGTSYAFASNSGQADYDLGEVKDQVLHLDPHWAKISGLQDLIDEFENDSYPAPLNHRITEVPVLSGLQPVDPIESSEELVDSIARAIEHVENGMDAELLLDGIARHSLLDSNDTSLADRAHPVLTRLQSLDPGEGDEGFIAISDGTLSALPLLQLALGNAKPKNIKGAYDSDAKHSVFFDERIYSMRQRLESRKLDELLATPTHDRGWIDPVIFVQRFNRAVAAENKINKLDFILAMLRLAPENRNCAYDDLSSETPSPWKELLVIAFDQDVDGIEVAGWFGDKLDNSLVCLVSHVRTKPLTEDQCKQMKVHPKLINGKSPVMMKWSTRIEEIKDYSESLHDIEKFESCCNILPPFSDSPFKDLFWAFQGIQKAYYWQPGTGWRFQMDDWNAKFSNDHYLLRAAHKLQMRIDDNSSMFDPNSDMLEALFEPDRVWSEIAHLAAVMALIGKDSDALGVGIDATIDAIEKGRANPEIMGQVIAKLFEHWSKRGRLAKSLGEIARLSSLHSWFVLLALEPLVETFDPMPRDAAKILEVYLDAMVSLKLGPADAVGNVLEKVKGSSKAAKLAKKILAQETGDPSSRQTAKTMAIQSRIERVERWETAKVADLAHVH